MSIYGKVPSEGSQKLDGASVTRDRTEIGRRNRVTVCNTSKVLYSMVGRDLKGMELFSEG